MKTLFLRIYLTVVAVLALFALGAGWLMERHLEQERGRAEIVATERMAAWGELLQRSLPEVEAPEAEQAEAVHEWSQRLRLPMALDDAKGRRIAASESFTRRQTEGRTGRVHSIQFDDGRTLWVMRPWRLGVRGGSPGDVGDERRMNGRHADAFRGPPLMMHKPPYWPAGAGLVLVLSVLFVAVAAGAWPVTRHLTRRLESLKKGVEQFGAGALDHRLDASGRDEVAAVAASFNQAADRVQALVRSNQSLLANASHELRSPLARLKMAVSLLADTEAMPEATRAEQRAKLQHEIDTNIAELDALVEEVLLASRLDAQQRIERHDPVDLMALLLEESARTGAVVEGEGHDEHVIVAGDERLLRRALRNLLENARRYGGGEVSTVLRRRGTGLEVRICDRGPGVPENMRERIFEPFFRLPGHAEQAGGVGLGLSLVKEIVRQHGGHVRCEGREGGGSCFCIQLPQASNAGAGSA